MTISKLLKTQTGSSLGGSESDMYELVTRITTNEQFGNQVTIS
ncbi:MAG TPA: hypothetical protein VI146_03890 [Nitrososphaeraceae archaeon]